MGMKIGIRRLNVRGHTRIKTTQRYAKVSNLKVQRDYYKAMEVILQQTNQESVEVVSIHWAVETIIQKA